MNDTIPVIVNTPLITYILEYKNKYYCGKTNNLNRRLKEHSKDKWKNYRLVYNVLGDHEKKIKSFGVERFFNCIITGVVS